MNAEPLLSANIYCRGQVDAVIGHAIVPYWRQVCGDSSSYLWLIRHARAGEHVKVRLHGPPGLEERARRLLETEVAACFDRLPPAPEVQPDPAQAALPVIDPEDAVDTGYPDRTLLWTTYRPSPVTFGAPVFAEDPSFQARFTRLLGAGCRIALDLFTPAAGNGAPLPVAKRQSAVFRLCLLTWQALPLDAATRSRYLAYHRDWLVRWTLAHSDPGETTRESVLELFDRKAATMEPALGGLASLFAQPPAEEDDPAAGDDAQAAYRRAVREYFATLVTFRGNPAYALDPYADDPVFLPLFKVLHNLANSIGLGIRQEAFAYHLLSLAADRVPQ